MTGDPRRPTSLAIWLDLLLIVGVGLLTVVPIVYFGDAGVLGPVQILLGFALVFFLPGYATVAAFYPSACFATTEIGSAGSDRIDATTGPTALERLVMAVGLSIMGVPLVVLIWNFSPWGIAAPQVLGSLVGIVFVGAVVAAYRRAIRPAATVFHLPLGRLTSRASRLEGTSSREATATVAVTILVVLSVIAVGLAVAVPESGEEYTELYLQSEGPESDSLLTDDDLPTIEPGESRDIQVGIGNRESRTITYTVVVVLQRIETIGGERRVVEEAELDRFTTTIEPGERTQLARDLVADGRVTGENLRVAFLLYTETPPSDPSVSNAYRQVHFWVSIPSE